MSWETQLARADLGWERARRLISQLRVRERELQAELKVCRAKIEALERILRGSSRKYRVSEKGRAAISRGAKKYWREYRAQQKGKRSR